MGTARARRFRGHGGSVLFRGVPASYGPVVRLWLLRLMVPLGGWKALLPERHVADDDVLRALGVRPPAGEYNPAVLHRAIERRHAKAELEGATPPQASVLARNLAWLADQVGLSEAEREILHFTVVQVQHPALTRALELMGNLSFPATLALFSRTLALPVAEVRLALSQASALTRSGLLTCDFYNRWSFSGKVNTLPGLDERLCVRLQDRMALFRQNFIPAPSAELTREDYPHVAEDAELLEGYLREALASRRPGVNVLLHGIPGSGKTAFVRMMAARLGARLFEVASAGQEDDPLEGSVRFRSYRLSQAVLGQKPGNLVLFDEVEDVFREDLQPRRDLRNVSGLKAWVNRTLETNPVPAFWITNHLGSLDPAYLRRFDYVLELGIPPRSVRGRILDGHLEGLGVSGAWKARMAEHPALAPALVGRAAKVVRVLHLENPAMDPGRALSRVLGNTLEALGAPREPRDLVDCATPYRPEILSADCDLATVLEGLRGQGEGRLCLYGPPGTGKSAFGRHVAKVLDRPLMVRRTSDLLSPYLGATEQNMARMFRQSLEEGSVLLLDEADSLLRNRQGATHSWEVTQVNEMLTQIEAFSGVFIASTNLMDGLDPAALRRFDLKIRFGYLAPDQAWRMFEDAALSLEFTPEAALRPALAQLRLLTPGDFATVLRQARIRPVTSCGELLARLRGELEAKPEGRRQAIGFTA